MAKDRLKEIHPNFTGFSSCGDSSLLPCLSGDCNDGVIDEVFMGTAQSCMELYRMKPPVSHHLTDKQQQQKKQQQQGGRPWQELLVRGDQLLRELQTQDKRPGEGSHKASTDIKGDRPQDALANNVVAHAADVVEAISKLADVLGGSSSAGEDSTSKEPAGLGSGSGLARARPPKGEARTPTTPLQPSPPVCDPVPDDPLGPEGQAPAPGGAPTRRGKPGKKKSKAEKGHAGNVDKDDDLPGKAVVLVQIKRLDLPLRCFHCIPDWLIKDIEASSASLAKTKKAKPKVPKEQDRSAMCVSADSPVGPCSDAVQVQPIGMSQITVVDDGEEDVDELEVMNNSSFAALASMEDGGTFGVAHTSKPAAEPPRSDAAKKKQSKSKALNTVTLSLIHISEPTRPY